MFLTGPEFLPELRAHRGRTLTLLDNAQAAGHLRVAQMNKQVLTNLDRMITEVEVEVEDGRDEAADAADNSRHLVTAAQQRAEQTRRRAVAAL